MAASFRAGLLAGLLSVTAAGIVGLSAHPAHAASAPTETGLWMTSDPTEFVGQGLSYSFPVGPDAGWSPTITAKPDALHYRMAQ